MTKTPEQKDLKIVETFGEVSYGLLHLGHNKPSCINGDIRVEKYRITIEKIDEPIGVVTERLEELYVSCQNWHHRKPLDDKAKSLGYTFKGEYGSKKGGECR